MSGGKLGRADVAEMVAWLRVQLDVDERAAGHAPPWPWLAERGGPQDDETQARRWVNVGTVRFRASSEQTAAHIVLHDPGRVRDDVAARRRILDEVVATMDAMDYQLQGEFGSGDLEPGDLESVLLVRLLAAGYARRPGYLERWRP